MVHHGTTASNRFHRHYWKRVLSLDELRCLFRIFSGMSNFTRNDSTIHRQHMHNIKLPKNLQYVDRKTCNLIRPDVYLVFVVEVPSSSLILHDICDQGR